MRLLLLILLIVVLTCGCTSSFPCDGVCVNKYMVDPGYHSAYPMYYVVYQDENGYNNTRQVSPDAYANACIGKQYVWSPI